MDYKVMSVEIPPTSIVDIPDGSTPLSVVQTAQGSFLVYLIPLSSMGLEGRALKIEEPKED